MGQMNHCVIHLPVYAQMSSRVMAKVRSGSFTTFRVSLVRLAPSCFPRWTNASPRARNLNHVLFMSPVSFSCMACRYTVDTGLSVLGGNPVASLPLHGEMDRPNLDIVVARPPWDTLQEYHDNHSQSPDLDQSLC